MVKDSERDIGYTRLYYLKEADIAMAQDRYGQAESYIDAFIATLPDEGKVPEEITKKFDEIEREWLEDKKALEREKENMGALEKKDMEAIEDLIYIEALKKKRVVCWQVSLNNGLFLA